MDYEIRTVTGTVEIREHDGEPTKLIGVSPPWDTFSARGAIRGGILEKFERGAFSNLSDDIVSTVEHDISKVLGRTSAGTLRLSDTPEGVRYEIDLPDTSFARDLKESVQRGDISGSSFEFMVPDDSGQRLEIKDGDVIRTVLKDGAVMRQIGPVARPAFKDAPAVSLRCEEMVKELTKAPIDAEAARKRAHDLREAELAVVESGILA